ncbi:MAG: hypothetical protein ACRD1T_20315 [Acidimicrobiia bacterium]
MATGRATHAAMTYTRQPAHWDTDTSGRKGFERRVRRALATDGEFELLDATDSFDEVDFELGYRGRRVFLEVKEKKQKYRDGWVETSGIPEEDLFILDELAARKIVLRAPRAYLLVHDKMNDVFATFGALELITMPKVRVNRSIDGGVATFKGKWLIDLRGAELTPTIEAALAYVKRRSSSEDDYWKALACHGRYEGEPIPRF